MRQDWLELLVGFFPMPLRSMMYSLSEDDRMRMTEIRVRAGQDVQLLAGFEELALPTTWHATPEDVGLMAQALLGHARYAREEELKRGYVTLPGGCRAGLCGRTILENGHILHLSEIGSIALRIARQMPGAADTLLPVLTPQNKPVSALLFSTPGQGKTTLLRDAARQISIKGWKVGMVDERSELAACVQGVPQLDVGPRTDVLDGCPKAEGMLLLLRAFSPQVLVTDEMGREADAQAIDEAARGGVAVWTTAHGASLAELRARPSLRKLMARRVFARYILLDASGTPGRVAGIWDGAGMPLFG